MTTVSIKKTLPSSQLNAYSGSGEETINLVGATSVIVNSKKDLTKIRYKQSENSWSASPSDVYDNRVLDLKSGNDDISIRGWLEDDDTQTAWTKFWKLRAMEVSGGPLTEFKIGDITFDSNTVQCFLEELRGTVNSDDSGEIQTKTKDGVARIEISVNIFVGDPR